MTESFLIAHKVRGEPAFDIAHQMPCPHCQAYENTQGQIVEAHDRSPQATCVECDQLGYWWIVSTSGHRAYPYTSASMLCHQDESISFKLAPGEFNAMPPDLPDHYPTRAAPTLSLAEALGFTNKPKPKDTSSPFPRRL